MKNDNDKKKQAEADRNREWYELTHKNWRAWGSWFSWGSPIGLALFFAIPMIAFGIMHWLINH